jgi:predicted RNA polymerase sigma factor
MGAAKVGEQHFRAAHRLARNDSERRFLEQRIAACAR